MLKRKEISESLKNDVRVLENFYINSQIDNLEEIVQAKKEELVYKISKFNEDMEKTIIDKNGEEKTIKKRLNPLIINNYFFKSINPLISKEPLYTAEKLGIVWELYSYLIARVNEEYEDIIPTVTNFSKFAGISLATLKSYKRSNDLDMRVVLEKIEDSCFDTNVTFAQTNKLSTRATMYRMEIEQDKVKKDNPQIHIHTENVDLKGINTRLKELMDFTHKKVIEETPKKAKITKKG
ncbi:MAG: hypothetical protein RR478_00900 [Bacilli bacterium]